MKNVIRMVAIVVLLCAVFVILALLTTKRDAHNMQNAGDVPEKTPQGQEDRCGQVQSTYRPIRDRDECGRRIAEQVAMITAESVAESLARLNQVNLFFWPGPSAEGGRVTAANSKSVNLTPDLEIRDVHVIVSNRRVLKLFEELRRISQERGVILLNAELKPSLAEYLSMFAQDPTINSDAWSEAAVERAIRQDGYAVGPGWVMESPNLNDTTFLGARYKVLALTWLSGELGFSGTNENIRLVTEAAIQQRNELYSNTEQSVFFRQQVLSQASLYNRIILAKGLIGTAPCKKELEKLAGENRWSQETIRATRYDASLSAYDLPVQSGVSQADFSRGEIPFSYYPNVSDKDIDQVIQTIVELNRK